MNRLKLAIQKSGRLHDDSIALLKEAGISINNGRDQLKAPAQNFPLEVYYLRNGDIPKYLQDGVVDLAIIGENLLVEKGREIEIIERLKFSKCRVSIAVPKGVAYSSIQDLAGKRIATSYPNTLKSFLDEQAIVADIHVINGSVEIAPNIGLSEAICDIVSSGSTLFKNNLKEVEILLKSEAVLAVSPKLDRSNTDLNELLFRLQGVLRARTHKYILMNVPKASLSKVLALLPGMRSPTVLPLAESDWVSVHTVIEEKRFWSVIGELKSAGAEGILVSSIEKMFL
ncbi:MAG: ATP phosphoribosyltransferase [Bacteroidetes bacterium]|nr:ATP phosphoribosyltransferase [Bacteroidota bacterium]